MISTLLFDAGGTLVMPNFVRMAEELAEGGVVVDVETLTRAEVKARLDFDRPDVVRTLSDPWLNYMHDLGRAAGLRELPPAAVERLRDYQTACVRGRT